MEWISRDTRKLAWTPREITFERKKEKKKLRYLLWPVLSDIFDISAKNLPNFVKLLSVVWELLNGETFVKKKC